MHKYLMTLKHTPLSLRIHLKCSLILQPRAPFRCVWTPAVASNLLYSTRGRKGWLQRTRLETKFMYAGNYCQKGFLSCLKRVYTRTIANRLVQKSTVGGKRLWSSNSKFFGSDDKNMAKTLEKLNFHNLALESLPLDSVKANHRRQVPNACFSLVEPTPVDNPQLVAYSSSALQLLDIDKTELERLDGVFEQYMSGNKLLPGSKTAAHCYCGHQFGHFSGQLGDGAAIYLGEIVNSKGERWELQLKGAGLTPYSRQADGRKVLRSSIREFLCSEAMYYLGIPTTRAGSCVTSDTKVVRDIFYTGDPILERATIVSRIAPTFLRFGSFEIFKGRDKITGRQGPSFGRKDILIELLEYSIKTFYPEIYEKFNSNKEECYLEFYREVVRRTATLAAEWQCVGFCHGVLNTDNMSIMGLTIDYGPFGFMDYFDPDHVCNASDDQGRYSYQNQPNICKWNCFKFAEALQDALPLKKAVDALEEIYDDEYKQCYLNKMRAKLGLRVIQQEEDEDLIEALMDTLKITVCDFSNTFRGLSMVSIPGSPGKGGVPSGGAIRLKGEARPQGDVEVEEVISYLTEQCQSAEEMKKMQSSKSNVEQVQLLMMLMQMNPGLFQQMGGSVRQLQQELEKIEKAKELDKLTQQEKTENDRKHWTSWLTKYRARLTMEVAEVPDENIGRLNDERIELMNQNNPRFLLRNHVAQNAIRLAEEGDFAEVRKVLKLLEKPYSNTPFNVEGDVPGTTLRMSESSASSSSSACPSSSHSQPSLVRIEDYCKKAPRWSLDLRVT